MDSIKKAHLAANFARQKKAEDVLILDLGRISDICNYFVIASGTSDRRVKAIAQGIEEGLKKKGQQAWHVEGIDEALWVLLDYGDVIIHVFYESVRKFYELERLWADAPTIRINENGKG